VTWEDKAKTTVPHTISIFDPKVVPVDFATAYICNWDRRPRRDTSYYPGG
jgi:hypothetical protein